jgi:hypothetical protein
MSFVVFRAMIFADVVFIVTLHSTFGRFRRFGVIFNSIFRLEI